MVIASKAEIIRWAHGSRIGGGMMSDANGQRRIPNDDLLFIWKWYEGDVEVLPIFSEEYEIKEVHLNGSGGQKISFLLIKDKIKKGYSNGVGAPCSPFHRHNTFEITRSDF